MTQDIVKFTYDEIGEGNPHIVRVGRPYQDSEHPVTRILQTEKNGEYCMIPYLTVMCGDRTLFEINRHKVHAVYFDMDAPRS